MSDDKIFVENGQKNKCPHCGITYSFENAVEALYRNITLFYYNKESMAIKIKCKQCKSIITIEKSD